MSNKPEDMPTTGNVTTAPTGEGAESISMNIYGGGDEVGTANEPSGAELMKQHANQKGY